MSQNGKLMPNLDQNSTRLLNLTVLQRIDPYIEEILITAAHVTFYEFNIELSQWSRKDVEGSLFVVKRSTQPRFQFIVMNRRNTDNLVENLLGDFEYEVQGPYLLYRNAAQEVNGIWFYNKRECEEVANLFDRIINAYSKANQKPKASSSKREYEELEAVPTIALMDGPLEPSSTTASTTADIPDDPAFVNYFSSAMALGNTTSTTPASGQPFQPPPAIPRPPNNAPPTSAAPYMKPPPILSSSSTPLMPLPKNTDPGNNTNMPTNLVKPSTFFAPPPSSSSRTMPPPVITPSSSVPKANHQRPYGAPLLQPFPPPNPPPSLAPNYGPVVTREKVREALLVLVQDNQFIDMVYRALQNAHHHHP
ncbi:PREDICTED: mRNA-decapping enzyme-like protein [Tarenaya hassleriana]|uniref:mRNA-decapping enzyme-like protein n=1 Tax=Tarenaya hassleriana TaxID=28532 RepID=UPI00053C51E7|nr:PREDICTED: mRNA-decapping enzyme-like protein [Tarenaya hassleriana]